MTLETLNHTTGIHRIRTTSGGRFPEIAYTIIPTQILSVMVTEIGLDFTYI
jgi:hypothetical protein